MTTPTTYPTLGEAARVWGRIAALSFGGPAGQIAVMHRILVDERKWIGDDRFLHALNFCMFLPGPEAQQLATYIGWLMHGVRGALIAGGLFILPGFCAIMALSWVYAILGQVPVVSALFFGLKAAVLAIVLQAVIRVGKRALKNTPMRLIAVLSFVAIFFFATPFPLVIAAAAMIGWLGAKAGHAAFLSSSGHGTGGGSHVGDDETLIGQELTITPRERSSALRAGVVCCLLWLLPVVLLAIFAPGSVFTDIATYFSKLALLTFGGAYAVLSWVAQAAVETYGWLKPGEMLDGLGMAETTPGPLIMVLQFVGFMGAFRDGGWSMSLLAGTVGGILTTWVTFAPCFAFIFLGAPYMERLRKNQALSAAMTAITAAVVGVILNLALWFALHVIWREAGRVEFGLLDFAVPIWRTLDPWALILSVGAIFAVFRLKLGMPVALAGAAGTGLILHFLDLA